MMNVKQMGLAAAVITASSLLVMGCGSKTADRTPAPNAWQDVADQQDVITSENFAAIQPGASIGDIETLYGQKGELIHQSIVNGIYTYTYRWHDGSVKVVDCTFTHENRLNNPISCAKLVRKELRATQELAEVLSSPVTKAQYSGLSYGMTLAAVKAALGMDGAPLGMDTTPGIETETYGWAIDDGRIARITFQNDQLIAMNLEDALIGLRIAK